MANNTEDARPRVRVNRNIITPKEPILWICPECNLGNSIIGACKQCSQLKFKSAFDDAVNASAEKRKYSKAFNVSLVLMFFGGWILVLPAFFATLSYWTDIYNPDVAAYKASLASPTPEPTPTPFYVPEPVSKAIVDYLAHNWNGWEMVGYNEQRTIIDTTNDSYRPSVVIRRDGHPLEIDLKILLINGNVWVAFPDNVPTSEPE